jgi:hypothetical protein
MEVDLIGRLQDGKRQALGIEEGSDVGPILIPQYYFSKNARVDWERGTVAAIGKIFHEVRVKWEREPPDPTRSPRPAHWIHTRELEGIWELGPPTEPEGFIDPREEWEKQLLDEWLLKHELLGNPEVQPEPQAPRDTLSSEPAPEKRKEAHTPSKDKGRPSKKPEIKRAIDILLQRGVDLANMPRQKAYKAVRQCAAKELNSNIKLGFTDAVIHRSLFKRFGPLR